MGIAAIVLPNPGAERSLDYPVSWRDGHGVTTGRLALAHSALVLRGADEDGAVRSNRVPLDRIASVRVGRTDAEQIRGQRSVVLELHGGDVIAVAPLGVAGAVFELADLVAELSSERRALDGRIAVVLPLRPDTAARARELVAEGPPFDVEDADLDGHHVFVSEREALFVFEGERARNAVERLVRDPRVLRVAARWQECLAGPPRLAEGTYAWRRDR